MEAEEGAVGEKVGDTREAKTEMYGRAGGGEVVGEDGGSSERRMGSGIMGIKWKVRQGLGGGGGGKTI